MIHTQLINEAFDPFTLLAKHQQNNPKIGAESIFIGTMRDFRETQSVDSMFIEHYSPMTEQQLAKLQTTICADYKLLSCFVAHRVGAVKPNDTLVVINCAASHRKNAIVATEKLLEALKHNVPLWKKEFHNQQTAWVDKNTPNQLN